MEDTFGINNVALVDGQPLTLGLQGAARGLRRPPARRRPAAQRATAGRRREERLHLVEGLLIAILDIDEVIAVIRSSDDTAAARARLMEVFDLSEIQANYILDMPLRRLTRFSRIELETERRPAAREIAELTAIIESDEHAAHASCPTSSARSPRSSVRRGARCCSSRRVLRAPPRCRSRSPTTRAGCCCRRPACSPARRPTTRCRSRAARAKHDVDRLGGALHGPRRRRRRDHASGRMIRLGVLDMPALPATASAPHLSGGAPVTEFLSLDKDEQVLALCGLGADGPGLALGTEQGVVKRVVPDPPQNKDSWEIVVAQARRPSRRRRRPDRRGSRPGVRHVRRPAAALRRGRRPSAGPLCRWDGRRPVVSGRTGGVLRRRSTPAADNVVVTVSGSSAALPGTDAGSVKVTPYAEYPAKGRGTGGVRCHRFLRGEDVLTLAWAGPAPARAAAATGVAVDLPPATGRRDGSGTAASQPIAAVAGPTPPG